jgi:hypothetical protein
MKYAIDGKLNECSEQYLTLQSILRQKKSKYKEEDLQNKSVRLERLNENLNVLRDLFND